jgi:hypothetical protein
MKRLARMTMCATILGSALLALGKDGGNGAYVVGFPGGASIYARCVPEEVKGSKGVTQVLRVRKEGDEILASYDWYNRQIFLGWSPTAGKVAVLRVAQDAGLAPDKQIELSFYLGNDLVKSYTTADLVKLGARLDYDGIAAERGITAVDGPPKRAQYLVESCEQVWNTNDYYFRVKVNPSDVTPRILKFDIVTGKVCRVERVEGENKERMIFAE